MPEQSNPKLELIPMSEQAKPGVLFQMELTFTVSESLTEIDNMLAHLDFKQYPTVQNSKTVKIQQTLPFIPDDETIKKYAQIIKDAHNRESGQTTIRDIQFLGFSYIRPVRPVPNQNDENPPA